MMCSWVSSIQPHYQTTTLIGTARFATAQTIGDIGYAVKKKPAGANHKPNSVPVAGYPATGDDHSSWASVTEYLMRPTRELGRAALERSSIWSCTGWGLPSFPGHPGNWCALTAPFHPYPASTAGRFTFCCTFLHVTVTPCYGAPCPVVFGLSSGNTLSQRSSGRLQPVAARAILTICNIFQDLSQYRILLQKGHNFKLSNRCNSL